MLSYLCRDDALLEFAETVIIGSGITGALIAHDLVARGHLTKGTGDGKASVVMLETRPLCSGATGRNGTSESHRSHEEAG